MSIEQDGPAFTLSAERPEARFSVRLCMDGTDDHRYGGKAWLRAQVKRTEGSGRTPVRVELEAAQLEDALSVTPDRPVRHLSLDLDAEGPWEEHTDHRCGDPQVVLFRIEAGTEEAQVEVQWDVRFRVRYGELLMCGERVDPTLSVEFEPVSTGR